MMKKVFIRQKFLLYLLIPILFFSAIVFTQAKNNLAPDDYSAGTSIEITQSLKKTAGIKLDSPWYFFDVLAEKIQYFFTLNPEKKIRLQMKFAKERMAEIDLMLEEKGITAQGIEITQKRLKEYTSRVTHIIDIEEQKGKDTSKLAGEITKSFNEFKEDILLSSKYKKDKLITKVEDLQKELQKATIKGDKNTRQNINTKLAQLEKQKSILEEQLKEVIIIFEKEKTNIFDKLSTKKKVEETSKYTDTANCGDVPHKGADTRIRYKTSFASYGSQCQSETQTRICANGSFGDWSGTYANTSCSVEGVLSCGNTPDGGKDIRTKYKDPLVSYSSQCQSETQSRTCANGIFSGWTGTYTNNSCYTDGSINCGDINHGGSDIRKRYKTSSVAYGSQCVSETQTRTCSNGSFDDWSGSNTYESCYISQQVPTSICNNNGIWDIGETLENCPNDCTQYCSPPSDKINVAGTGDYIIGAYLMPGWYPGADTPPPSIFVDQSRFEWIWEKINASISRILGADQPIIPLVNPFDESNPIAIDWMIKWGLEHGVSLFIYDWFWFNGTNLFDNSKSLEQGILKSKYIDKYPLKFAVMWTNAYDATYSDVIIQDRNKMMSYVIKNYFKHPNYLKIDGKPAFFIFRNDNIPTSKYIRASAPAYGKYGSQILNRTYATDNRIDNNSYAFINSSQNECIELNLGYVYAVNKIEVWHRSGRIYNNSKVLVSKDKKEWFSVFKSKKGYLETSDGKTYLLDEIPTFQGGDSNRKWIRYVRDCISGNNIDSYNHWVEIKVWGNDKNRKYRNLADNLAGREQTEIGNTLDYWRNMAKSQGLDGIYFVNVGGMFSWQDSKEAKDAGIEGLTSYYYYTPSKKHNELRYASYADLINYYKSKWKEQYQINNNYFPLVTTGYDDTMKFQGKGRVITDSTPANFKKLLKEAKLFVDSKNINPKIIITKAWNEWPESSALAPTKNWGFGFLESIKDVFCEDNCGHNP